jgi:hypothetical protein
MSAFVAPGISAMQSQGSPHAQSEQKYQAKQIAHIRNKRLKLP